MGNSTNPIPNFIQRFLQMFLTLVSLKKIFGLVGFFTFDLNAVETRFLSA